MGTRHAAPRIGLSLIACLSALVSIAGCSSDTPQNAGTSTTSASSPATPSPSGDGSGASATSPSAAQAQCTKASLRDALPQGSKVDRFSCAIVSPSMWAAVALKNGGKTYFLRSTAGPWKVVNANKVCGDAVKGMPEELQAYCT